MKKEEIKKDPIRDKILNTLTYLSDNPQKFIKYTIAITISLLAVIIYTNKNANRLKDYNLGTSINQNRYLDNNKDLAIIKFKEIIEDYSHSESSNQAFIYLLNDAIERNDMEAIDDLMDNYSFSTSDKTLQSLIYNSYANHFVSIDNFSRAEEYYNKAISFSENKEHTNKFYLNLIYLHMNNDKSSKAASIIDDIAIEDITPYQLKNKFEQIKSSLN